MERRHSNYKSEDVGILDLMHPDSPANAPQPKTDSQVDLDDLLDRLVEISRSSLPREAFCDELLESVRVGVEARAGVVWLCENENWSRAATAIPPGSSAANLLNAQPSETVRTAAVRNGPSFDSSDASKSNPQCTMTIAYPVLLDQQPIAVIEVVTEHPDNASTRRGLTRILSAFADTAADYFAHDERRRLKQSQSTIGRLERYIEEINRDCFDWKRAAYSLANESRALLGAGRVTVLRRKGWSKKYRTVAISGAHRIDRRAKEVESLERLARRAAPLGEVVRFGLPGESADAETLFSEYVDAHHSKSIVVAPLVGSDRWPEIIAVIECYDTPENTSEFDHHLGSVMRFGGLAASNSLRLERTPLRPFTRRLERVGALLKLGRIALVLLVVAMLVATAYWTVVTPAQFEISARGVLEPKIQRRVFAPANGMISDVAVRRGDAVTTETVLLKMQDKDLNFEEVRINGELQTLEAELSTVRTKRIQGAEQGDPKDDHELAAREKQIQHQCESYRKQLAILANKRADLSVTSPISGVVIEGDLQRNLAKRQPVVRGQRLLVVAETEGEWRLRLQVPDERMKHLLDRVKRDDAPVTVRFMLASHPGRMYEGRLDKIAMAAQLGPDNRPAVEVTASFDREQIEELRAGADVAARIDCGERSIAYVWLHGLIERIRLQFFI